MHFPHAYRTLEGRPGGKDGKPVNYVQAKTPLALFDLESDPGEKTNVADKNAEVVKKLEALAEKARKDLGDQRTKTPGSGVRQPGSI